MLLADAIKLIEEDGPTIEAFMGEVMAIEAGRLCSAGRRMNSFYIAKRSLPLNGFRSKALAKLDPRVGYGEQIMLKIAEGAAIFIISLLSSMRPSESRRLTTASVKPSNALGMPAGAETSDLIEGVLSKSGRPHEWVAAPAVSDAIAFLGFYPEITDGCKRAENFWSCLATLRRILGLWNRSMYSNTSALAASSVG